MSDIDVPAGQAGGLDNVSESSELPARLRVHALAKLIAATSRQVLDALTELGEPAKGVQSSIDRDTALRVIAALSPEGGPGVLADHDIDQDPDYDADQVDDADHDTDGDVDDGFDQGVDHGLDHDTVAGLGSASSSRRVERPVPLPDFGVGPVAESLSFGLPPELDPEPESPFGALPLFAAPSPMFLPPEPVARPAARAVPPAPASSSAPAEEDNSEAELDESGETKRRRRRGRRGRGRGRGSEDEPLEGLDTDDLEPGGPAGRAGAESSDDDEAIDPSEDEADASSAEDSDDDDTDEDGDDTATGEDGTGPSRRRRRRRRRKESSDSDVEESDDPPNTVTRIREARSGRGDSEPVEVNQGIQGVRGSTRLEAKRQRRRDGRDAGRRRAPVISEAEFLARRESVERTMVVRQHGERSEIGVLEDGVLVEHFVTSSGGSSLVGNVYLGRVQNVLPSMEAAFVDIGRGRNAVLYAGEVDWDAAGLAGKARRIEQALSSGDNILVQVTKDPIGHKGARLTTQISLPGRFLVYVPSGGTHGISRKLPDNERRRLKDLLKEIVPDDAGVIIRTASEGVSQEALERDVRRLQAQWDVVKTKAEAAKGSSKSKAPELLYEEPDLMIKVVRDQFNEDFSKLVVSGDDAWDTLHAYISHVAPELTERLRRHVGTSDVFTEHRIDEQLAKALDRKVWLPSGGTLVIDRTEAMTVIDVNTGKFTGSGGNLEETVTRNNLEAAEEIVRQLRLRDIGGIIVVDFIDMVLESNRDLVLRRLTECLGRDRTRHQVAEVTSLGLVQMTRKRVGVGLLEAFSTPCEHCRGRGVVVSSDPVEPRHESGQHGAPASGRRRGRGGGEHTEPVDRGGHNGNGGHSGNGGSGGSSGSGNAGRRRGGNGGAGNESPASQGKASDGGPVNGRPVPHPPPPGHTETVVAEISESAGPLASPEPISEPVTEHFVEPVVEPVSELVVDHVVEPVVERPVEQLPVPVPVPQPTKPAEQADEHGGSRTDHAPVAVGAPADETARPARRRRRSASRPAGPPGGG
jgi:ribonuclease E